MRFNALRLVLLVMVISAVAALGICNVRGDEKNEGSRSGNPTTNSPSTKPKQNGLKQLEQDLFRPFETLAPKGSLDGAYVPSMPPPQPAPSVQSKRAKELLEHRRDWVFETPDEILAGPSTDDKSSPHNNKKESAEQLKLSPLERFYERLYNKEKKGSSQKGNKRDERSDSLKLGILSDESDGDDDDLPLGVRETQREMRRLLAPKERKEDSSLEPSRSGFSDIFGLGKNTRSQEEMEIQRERMDRYKELVGLPVIPRLNNDPVKQFRDMVGTSPRSPGLIPTMDTLGKLPQQNTFGLQSGSTAVTPNTSLLPAGATIQNTPSLAPVLPKIEPPKSLPPPVTFGAPRRAF